MKTQNLEQEIILLNRAKNNKKEFDNLYKYFVNDVYRFSYSILNNAQDAEDITSQTFVEFYKKLDDYVWQDVSIKYWLFKTARNLSYKKLNKPTTVEFDEEYHIEDEYEISFVDEIMNRDLLEKVKSEIQTLKPQEQEIINLRIWEGMAFAQIAEVEGISENAAKKRFYKSIDKLKESLNKKGIKQLIALPVLFTAISQVGLSPAYAAPISLASTGISALLISNTSMSTFASIKAFLATKAGIAAVAGVTTVTAVTGGVVTYENVIKPNQDNKQQEQKVTPTTTQVVTSIPTATPQPTTEYTNTELGITFTYPSAFKVEKTKDVNFATPIVTITKNSGTYLVISQPTGLGDATQNLTKSPELLTLSNGKKIVKVTQSNQLIYGAFLTEPNKTNWSGITSEFGYYIQSFPLELSTATKVTLFSNNPSLDSGEFDDIVKSIKRYDPTADWKTHKSSFSQITFKYPENHSLTETKTGNLAQIFSYYTFKISKNTNAYITLRPYIEGPAIPVVMPQDYPKLKLSNGITVVRVLSTDGKTLSYKQYYANGDPHVQGLPNAKYGYYTGINGPIGKDSYFIEGKVENTSDAEIFDKIVQSMQTLDEFYVKTDSSFNTTYPEYMEVNGWKLYKGDKMIREYKCPSPNTCNYFNELMPRISEDGKKVFFKKNETATQIYTYDENLKEVLAYELPSEYKKIMGFYYYGDELLVQARNSVLTNPSTQCEGIKFTMSSNKDKNWSKEVPNLGADKLEFLAFNSKYMVLIDGYNLCAPVDITRYTWVVDKNTNQVVKKVRGGYQHVDSDQLMYISTSKECGAVSACPEGTIKNLVELNLNDLSEKTLLNDLYDIQRSIVYGNSVRLNAKLNNTQFKNYLVYSFETK